MNGNSRDLAYPWYAQIDPTEPVQQGDFVLKCQIIQPKVEAKQANKKLNAIVKEYDVIIMSQSCDLVAEKINLVLVCPFYTLTELGKIHSEYKSSSNKEKLRKGHVLGMHLLNECNINGITDFLVVDFKSVYAIPLPLLKQIVLSRNKRNRLLSPYREHLSQAFARFFMRVGLPVDIPVFK
ncbi:MAG: hypothetical protein PHW83_11115 [Bacteroidales bacterium]|jgi:hypothetical protein|nr:hypothetical protein [Bacteroidales bacterium]